MMNTNIISKLENNFPEEACLFLFGNEDCKLCNPIKYKLEIASKESENKFDFHYIDTSKNLKLAASLNIFTVPVVIFSIQGNEQKRWVRTFSIIEIINYCNRIIDIFNTSKNEDR